MFTTVPSQGVAWDGCKGRNLTSRQHVPGELWPQVEHPSWKSCQHTKPVSIPLLWCKVCIRGDTILPPWLLAGGLGAWQGAAFAGPHDCKVVGPAVVPLSTCTPHPAGASTA
jgi:hypothetical protein